MNAAEAVANGAQLLDERYPGWYRKINLDELEISNGCSCICGQLGSYERDLVEQELEFEEDRWLLFAEQHLGCPEYLPVYSHQSHREWATFVTEHGFANDKGGFTTHEWKLAIQARLDADSLEAPNTTATKEMVCA